MVSQSVYVSFVTVIRDVVISLGYYVSHSLDRYIPAGQPLLSVSEHV